MKTCRWKPPGGGRLNVEVVSNAYQVDHHKVVQCNIRDITERRQSETKLAQLGCDRSILPRMPSWERRWKT